MDTFYKNRLQEYCQKRRLSMPVYLPSRKTGPDHSPSFQTTVIVNGSRYSGHSECKSVKQAEQSAAKHALQKIISKPKEEPQYLPTNQLPQRPTKYFPAEYADIERILVNIIRGMGGRIENVSTIGTSKRYKVNICGSNRYCENIKRHHKKSQIYFLVNPAKKIYYQKCYHPTCSGFRSSRKRIIL